MARRWRSAVESHIQWSSEAASYGMRRTSSMPANKQTTRQGGATDAPVPSNAAATESSVCNTMCSVLGVEGPKSDDFCDALMTFGAQAAWIEEAVPDLEESQPIFMDPIPGRGAQWLGVRWFNCRIVALFPPDCHREELEAAVHRSARTAACDSALELSWSSVYEADWEAQVRASYVPLQLTDDLWIIPEWCEPPDPSKTNLLLKPGLAFGTGEHATTRLCLRWLQNQDLARKSVIDYGCGSGILAIGSLLYGASHVVGVDVDALAVRASTLNAELNGVDGRSEFYVTAPSSEEPEPLAAAGASRHCGFDVCMANILRPALLDLQPRLAAYVRQGGTIALSGILEHQAPDVVEAYSRDFADLRVALEGEWALVTGIKR